MTTRDPAPPPIDYVQRSGGLFLDQAIHDFDMARYLLGEDISRVYAVGGCLIDPAIGAAGDIDTAMITLTSASGRFVQMNNCRRAAFGSPQNYFIERFAQAYRLEMAAFVALLRNGEAPLAGISDGLEAQRLAEAARTSYQTGLPVEIARH
jgi:myo-inositol 2-dehydrogenase/D-chiro-inositol 1-dehydrogenase